MKTLLILFLLTVSAGAIAQVILPDTVLDKQTSLRYNLKDSTVGNQQYYTMEQLNSTPKQPKS